MVTEVLFIIDYVEGRAGVLQILVYVGEMSFVLILQSW